jgi:hypothetical protein
VQVRRSGGGLLAVRWTGLMDETGAPAAFDVLLETHDATTDLVLQWLTVPPAFARDGTAVEIQDLLRDDARAFPVEEGLRLRSGSVIVLPGDEPWHPPAMPKAGCGIATNWCTVVTSSDPGCITPSNHADETSCATTQEKRWHFNEGFYCRSCPYTFYITVECGTEMHLPFRDMEGNQIEILDVFTGTEMELEATNDCAKQAFQYCNFCPGPAGIFPDPTGTICPAGPHIDCIPYVQRSTLIQWGYPPQDLDGDTQLDDLPCGPPNDDGCGGYGSGAYPEHEEQNTDVVLRGSPALCGVFRLRVLSGGFHWYLSANCTGIVPDDPVEIASGFNIYQNCADALAAFDPVPELAITKLEFTGACPNIELVIEVTNLGCVDAAQSPIHLDFSFAGQPDLDVDLGPVAAGTAVTMRLPVALQRTPQTVTATVDALNVISECTEQAVGSFSGCRPTSGADSLAADLCLCTNTVQAEVADHHIFACNGQPVAIDASESSAVPCTGGVVEYKVLGGFGAVIHDWDTDPITWVTPTRCPALDVYTVQARCSTELAGACVDAVGVLVECERTPALVATASPLRICAGETVNLEASGGFFTYEWSDGASGRAITSRPGASTTYTVTATTAQGCVSTAQVDVIVDPDPLPGPMGAWLRARKDGGDEVFTYRELPQPVSEYALVLHAADGTVSPCANLEPPVKPTPGIMDVAAIIDRALPGDPQPALRHVGALTACPKLLFYKVVGLSPCRAVRGTACDGEPMQLLPCP